MFKHFHQALEEVKASNMIRPVHLGLSGTRFGGHPLRAANRPHAGPDSENTLV